MKYSKDTYESGTYFKTDCQPKQKLVTVRYDHTCVLCDSIIPKGEKSIAFNKCSKSWGCLNSWLCLSCCDEWLEATHQVSERRTEV